MKSSHESVRYTLGSVATIHGVHRIPESVGAIPMPAGAHHRPKTTAGCTLYLKCDGVGVLGSA